MDRVVARRPRALVSGGQRQRLAAARLLLSRARFLIFDEPTAHLGPPAVAELQRRLAALVASGRGVLAITRDPAAIDPFDEVVELSDGKFAKPKEEEP